MTGALTESDKSRFQLLLRIAEEGDLVLLSCSDEDKDVPTICAFYVDKDGMECFVPLARLSVDDLQPPEREVKNGT